MRLPIGVSGASCNGIGLQFVGCVVGFELYSRDFPGVC